MSRDAYDDGYDDGGGRSGGRGRGDDGGYDDGGYDDGREPSVLERARNKVSLVGIFQLVFAFGALLYATVNLVMVAVNPEFGARWGYEFEADQRAKQPNAPPMPPFEEYLQKYIMQTLIINSLWLLTSIPMILGGFKMRALKSYGLSLTGAIIAVIPCCNGCICCAIPVGVWTLIVLLNADVKEGFRLTAQRASY